ncbi:MAG: PfkB family carbohydrate kinase [Microgenomates group bacterium]
MKSLILGTFAIDDISLPKENLVGVVGGATSYAGLASGLFTSTGVAGVAGADFPQKFVDNLSEKGIDVSNIQRSKKPSFRWKALYSNDLVNLTTTYLSMNAAVDLDVDKIDKISSNVKVVFLSNLDPEYQLKMVNNIPGHVIKLLDSLDLWIVEKRDVLKKVLSKVDIYFVSEDEAKLLIGKSLPVHEMVNEIMQLGPKVVVIKKGRHGLSMFGSLGIISIPSYPMVNVVDPSGAGDSLGGAVAGVLARLGTFNFEAVATALFLGSVVSSFVVEGHTLEPLLNLTLDNVLNRADMYLKQLPSHEHLLLDRI